MSETTHLTSDQFLDRTKWGAILDTKVTVCSACLRASCWQGHFYCDEYKSAATVEKTVEELSDLNREHPSYYIPKERP